MKQVYFLLFLLTAGLSGYAQQEYLLLAPVKENGLWGYINNDGQYVITPQFDFASEFSEGLAAVQINDKWGYINGLGSYVMNPIFDNAYNFSEGLARIQTQDGWGFINSKGEYVVTPQFEIADDFSDGLALVGYEGKYGYVAPNGQYAITPQFEEAYHFTNGIALVRANGQWKYYDYQQSKVTEEQFEEAAHCFSEGLAAVKVEGKYAYIDMQGRYSVSPTFENAGPFVKGLAAAQSNGLYGFVSTNGQYVIPAQYQNAKHFSEGLAAVQVNGKYGYIDRLGNWVIAPLFKDAKPFKGDIAKVNMDDKWGYIDTQGKFIIVPQFDWAFDFSESLATIAVGDKYGYINTWGDFVVNPRFEDMGTFRQVAVDESLITTPIVSFVSSMYPTTTEDSYLLQAHIKSTSPLVDYLVFVNNQLQDLNISNKGTNIKPIKKTNKNYSIQLEMPVALSEGMNEIFIKAINTKGSGNSSVVKIAYTPSKYLEKPDLYVLSIGIADYEKDQYNLNFSDKDALDFAGSFEQQKRMSYEERLFDRINIRTLVNEEASAHNIRKTILELKEDVTSNDLFILHLSSHGDIDNVGDFHIRTYDTDARYLAASSLHNKRRAEQIQDFDWTVVQFVDACHSGQGSDDIAMKGAIEATNVAVKELKQALESKAIYFFASSSSRQLSQERHKWENGAFTEAILSCFSNKEFRSKSHQRIISDQNEDGFINTNELGNYVSSVVKILTDGQQHPKATVQNGEPINLFVIGAQQYHEQRSPFKYKEQ